MPGDEGGARASGAIPRRLGPWDLVTIGVVLFTLLGQLFFLSHDTRVLRDLNLCYSLVPTYHEALADPWRFPSLAWHAFRETTGVPSLALAGLMRLTGGRAAVFHLMGAASLGVIILATASMARRLWGPAVGAGAAAFVGGAPAFFSLSRHPWLHVPEAALLLLAAAALVADPGLRRWSTVSLAALGGFGALTFRPSAVPWVATLGIFLLLSHRAAGGRARISRRQAVLGVAWALGLVPSMGHFQEYLANKVGMRENYFYLASLEALVGQVMFLLGPVSWVLALGGVCLFLAPPRLRGSSGRGAILALSWLGMGFGLHLLFRAGLDNFPLAAAGAAMLGAAGLRRLSPAAVILPLLTWSSIHSLQLMPEPVRMNRAYLAAFGELLLPAPNNYLLPWKGLDKEVVLTLLDATCPGEGACVVFVDHSLFHPTAEEPGRLELFLLDRPQVELVPIFNHSIGHPPAPDAWASYSCRNTESHWLQRFPFLPDRIASLTDRFGMVPVWYHELPGACKYRWLTPRGEVERPDLLPPGGYSPAMVTHDPGRPSG